MIYTSNSQRARVFSESWFATHGYCLACESDHLLQTAANTQARDFECERCRHAYELKSAMRPFGKKIVDGAFASMMRRVEGKSLPTFVLLQYTSNEEVIGLSAIHQTLITPEIIERRRPLASTARRAGWVGCNILLDSIPPEGRITLVENGVALPRAERRQIFAATAVLATKPLADRSWARELLSCLHRLPNKSFSLQEVYGFEDELGALYPSNHNVRAKIRQQLQVLRDAGLIIFERPGWYRLSF